MLKSAAKIIFFLISAVFKLKSAQIMNFLFVSASFKLKSAQIGIFLFISAGFVVNVIVRSLRAGISAWGWASSWVASLPSMWATMLSFFRLLPFMLSVLSSSSPPRVRIFCATGCGEGCVGTSVCGNCSRVPGLSVFPPGMSLNVVERVIFKIIFNNPIILCIFANSNGKKTVYNRRL